MAPEERPLNWQNIKSTWQGLSRARRISIVVLAGSLVLSLALLAFYFSRPSLAPLFHGLDTEEAAAVIERLKEMNVPYELEDEGSTVLVPRDKVYELRLQLSSDGVLYNQGVGFEIFDEKNGVGMTDFERQIARQRALQEELRRTIVSLEGVDQARVHLVLPEPSVFLRDTAEPSASVYLKLNPLASLDEEQVKGIVYLVAGSVENLRPENITVIDSHGNILFDAIAAGESGRVATDSVLKQLEVKREFERELEQQVQRMLEQVLGPGRALVVVNAELDFDAQEVTATSYDEPVLRSTKVIEEDYEGEGAPVAEAGTDANIPGYAAVWPGGEGTYSRREEITNYEVGEVTERQVAAPGRVKRISTAVVVDDSQVALDNPAQVEQIQSLVASAIGFEPERGDQISVEGMNFERGHLEEMEAAIAAAEAAERQRELIRQGIWAAVAVIAGVLFVVMWRRRSRPAVERLPEEEEKEEEALSLKDIMPEPPVEEDLSRRKLKEMAEKEPEEVAHLLRTWLTEE